jgi:hypothetical protein
MGPLSEDGPVLRIVGARFSESDHLRWPLDPEEAGYLVSWVGLIARMAPLFRWCEAWITRAPATAGKRR